MRIFITDTNFACVCDFLVDLTCLPNDTSSDLVDLTRSSYSTSHDVSAPDLVVSST